MMIEGLLGEGLCLNNLGNYKSALESFDKLLNLNSKLNTALQGKLIAHINIAEEHMEKEEYEKSLDNYQMALNIELNNKKALLGKGLVLIELRKFKEALEIINVYLKEVPS